VPRRGKNQDGGEGKDAGSIAKKGRKGKSGNLTNEGREEHRLTEGRGIPFSRTISRDKEKPLLLL